VRVAFRCVEEQIADAGASNMLVFLRNIGELDAPCDFGSSPHVRRLSEVRLSQVGEAEQPENGVWQSSEDAQPATERCRLDLRLLANRTSIFDSSTYLVQLVEVAEDNRIVRQLGKKFSAHRPSPLLLLLPARRLTL